MGHYKYHEKLPLCIGWNYPKQPPPQHSIFESNYIFKNQPNPNMFCRPNLGQNIFPKLIWNSKTAKPTKQNT